MTVIVGFVGLWLIVFLFLLLLVFFVCLFVFFAVIDVALTCC